MSEFVPKCQNCGGSLTKYHFCKKKEDMSEDKVCPFCGAENKPFSSNPADHCKPVGSYEQISQGRSRYCYDRQLSQQAQENEQLKSQIIDLNMQINSLLDDTEEAT